jgi:Peptidase family M23/Bacterial pre-peptidase C-terminal domain
LQKHLIAISVLFVLIGVLFVASSQAAIGAPPAKSTPFSSIDQAIWEAIRQEAASRPEAFLFEAYDWELSRVTYSEDRSHAVVWLDPLDPLTGMTIATEPMLVIVALDSAAPASLSSSWKVVFSGDAAWRGQAAQVSGLLPQEMTSSAVDTVEAPETALAALGGYRLPWAAGLTKSLVWSTEHTSCPGSDCYYAFDFADGTMFPLLAAKGGTVFYAKDTCTNGATDCTNIFILRDVSTTPTSYQIYYHLAQNTIPAALHTIGASVSQGQYIGNADDTGYSSGHHLHFMVHTSSYGYWGPSVDITFRDVSINWDPATQGGRPRTQAGAAISGGQWQISYTSGNVGANPPTGGLTLPADKQTVTDQMIVTSGWGTDNVGVTRMQLIAYFDNTWHEVGDPQTANPFSYSLNICNARIPVGPFNLALRAWDVEGNQTQVPLGTRHLVNAADCTTPTSPVCLPNSNQVAIYSDIDYSGVCKLLGIGNHDPSQLAPVSSNDAASVIIGDNVQLRMYDGDSWSDRRETLTNSDRNLADNPINLDHLSSASVQLRTLIPALGLFVDGSNDPHGPSSADPSSIDSITVAWRADGATKYQTRIFPGTLAAADECGGSGYLIARTPEWSIQPTWSIGTLPAGNYTWCARGRITDGSNNQYFSNWEMEPFPVTSGALPTGTTRSVPFSDNVESGLNGWTGSGLWRLIEDTWNSTNHVWACNNTDNDYGDPTLGGGDLTSAPIQIPTGGAMLRFDYRYETESDQVFWDQRWVQISQNGGRFQNLVQLSEDAMDTWRTSPTIDLSAYAGSVVRIRFHFSTTDKYYNGGMEGWLVDNVSVTLPGLQGCEESSNNTVESATPISLGEEVNAEVCPAGDVDYYKFSALKGDKLIASVDALQLEPSSLLDTHLTLLDQDAYGNSPIDSNDDMQPGVMTDSQLYIQVPEDGQYYLKVKSADHPTSGGSNYFYSISLHEQPVISDTVGPNLTMVYPTNQDGVPSGLASLSALAEDPGCGVSRVEFWWHSPNWSADEWTLLARDAYGDDGWQAGFDGSGYTEGQSGALAVIAYDWENNTRLAVDWDVTIDNTPPVTSLMSLPAMTDGTGILLTWNATDARSRLGSFDIQYQADGGSWQTGQTNIPGTQRSTWFVGQPGHSYAFRMRGRDMPGNLEPYPDSAEVTTQTAGACEVDPYDLGMGDGAAGLAVPLLPDIYQDHNYCSVGDIDWTGFFAHAGQELLISVLPGSDSPAGSSLDLYQSSESGWLLHREAPVTAGPLSLYWVAPADGLYLIRLVPKISGVSGNNATYRIRVGSGWWLDFPVIIR